MLYTTIYTNHDSGRGFASSYTISATCRTLMQSELKTNISELNKRGERVIKIKSLKKGQEIESVQL